MKGKVSFKTAKELYKNASSHCYHTVHRVACLIKLAQKHITSDYHTNQMKKNIFEPLPDRTLSRLPSPFYAEESYTISMDFSEISRISDSFSREVESIIEQAFGEKLILEPSERTSIDSCRSIASPHIKNDDWKSAMLSLTVPARKEKSQQPIGYQIKVSSLKPAHSTACLPTIHQTLESTPEQFLCTESQGSICTQEHIKRELKGDVTGEPVLEVAADNNATTPLKVRAAAVIAAKRIWHEVVKFADSYPVITKEEALRQREAFNLWHERNQHKSFGKASHAITQCVYAIVIGPYYAGKVFYKEMLRRITKHSIKHLNEFQDITYEEILRLVSEKRADCDSSVYFREWARTSRDIAQTPASTYRTLGRNTSSLLPWTETSHKIPYNM